MARVVIDRWGTKTFYDARGEPHRENGPAVISKFGGEEWWFNGGLHRADGPALTLIDGEMSWCINGDLHREEKPAIIHPNGLKEWWKKDKQIWPKL